MNIKEIETVQEVFKHIIKSTGNPDVVDLARHGLKLYIKQHGKEQSDRDSHILK